VQIICLSLQLPLPLPLPLQLQLHLRPKTIVAASNTQICDRQRLLQVFPQSMQQQQQQQQRIIADGNAPDA